MHVDTACTLAAGVTTPGTMEDLNSCLLESVFEDLNVGRLFDEVWQGVPNIDNPAF